MLRIKRIYEDPSKDDGTRILVDRLWARGITKEDAKLDEWEKEIAPTNETRKLFDHEAAKFEDFEKEYKKELDENKASNDFVKLIKDKLKLGNVTLLYGAKNEEMNNAVVLKEWLDAKL